MQALKSRRESIFPLNSSSNERAACDGRAKLYPGLWRRARPAGGCWTCRRDLRHFLTEVLSISSGLQIKPPCNLVTSVRLKVPCYIQEQAAQTVGDRMGCSNARILLQGAGQTPIRAGKQLVYTREVRGSFPPLDFSIFLTGGPVCWTAAVY